MKKELCVKSQSIETSGITKDYKEALCEYIWNGFEANAVHVSVNFTSNSLEGVESVIIQDDGDGICLETIDDTFGAFLASNKNSLSLQLKSKANKGKGRFSCYAFARRAVWETVVDSNGKKITYSISINSENKNEYDISEPTPIDANTGTVVTITGIDNLQQEDMAYEALNESLLKTFAWYLYLNRNKGVSLTINGIVIDFTEYIDAEASITKNIQVDGNNFSVTLIVWKEKIRENFCSYYLDEEGILHGKDTTTFNRNTINFNHSVYVKGKFFSGKENVEENIIVELKAPKIALTKKVLRQVEDYMDFIRRQPKFNSQHRRWKFLAVCSEVDDDVKSRYVAQETYGKKGLVTKIENYEVYALTWDDVFKSFELRHSFLLDKLKVDQEAIATELTEKTGDTKSKDVADAIKHEVCTA